MNERRNDLEIMNWIPQIALQIQTRIDLLFTMSENTQAHVCEDKCLRSDVSRTIFSGAMGTSRSTFRLRRAKPKGRSVVEPDGIEPTTSCLQTTRPPS